MSLLGKIFGDGDLSRYKKIVEEINLLENEMEKLSPEGLKGEIFELKKKIADGTSLDEALPRSFALTREASKRTLKQRHFDVQLMGGITLHEGKIAEMRTGEGKTLAATLPATLNALSGKGVHVITVNDYLAKRDTVWMGQIYDALGLKVACLVHDASYIYDPSFLGEEKSDEERDALGSFKVEEKFLRPVSRKEAYESDIVYGTNHEFGFDYLRDNLILRTGDRAQRGHYHAIIDEIDSILIDEARTPLIIAGPDEESSEYYKVFAKIVLNLEPETDYSVDEKMRTVSINESGIEKVEKLAGVGNIYAPENSRLVHFLQESLKAKALFKKDKDYIVKNGEVIIVDEFTGRMLLGRRYSGGLHQAIEAKEGVNVRKEDRTYAQITIQNYFRLYEKISGMTGTAQTSAEEFHKVYKLDVITVPTNKKMVREDLPDNIYKTKKAKYEAVVKEIKEQTSKGRPVLVGTTSIENNEIISSYLSKAGIAHEVLNAKNHEREGAIIAQAGKSGAVTVATNMAGRGVDIILGGNPPDEKETEKIKQSGGLFVLGTERHEARRIDNQLRGRAGRQGDPGSTQFFTSLEDDLMRIFGGDRIKRLMETLNFPEDMPIQSKTVVKAIDQAQIKVEGANFDIRQHLLDFDDVLNKQRTAIYTRRSKTLEAGENNEILPIVKEMVENFASETAAKLRQNQEMSAEEKEKAEKQIADMEEKISKMPEKIDQRKSVIIAEQIVRITDALWVDHLEQLDGLRESVNIRAYGQHDPLVEYRREAHILYRNLQSSVESLIYGIIFQIFEMDLNKIAAAPAEKAKTQTPPEYKEIGRNDPCWCGSGKKFKKCHGA
ncbi:preprotein translocase subunit SecA [Patescibacteria group bacterium]|nr:preprotein translocase subunit SecA [Patescibacteria group bacterium]